LSIAVFSTSVLGADSKVDPSGTWRWEHDRNGETVKDVLRVQLGKEGSVTGTYEGSRAPIEIQKGKLSGDEITFEFPVELPDGNKVTVRFDGKIKDDDVAGKVLFVSDMGDFEFPWEAKRAVLADDVLGKWQLSIETPDGLILEPVLHLKQTDNMLEAEYTDARGTEYEIRDLAVKENNVHFTVIAEFDGNQLTAKYKGRPFGESIKGIVAYEIAGNTGEIEFNGKRQPAKKEKDAADEPEAETDDEDAAE
jgi:hypothetical protein